MADPTLALDFQALQIRVADFLGTADYSSGSAAAVPSDAIELERVKRIVNNGYRRFLTDHEKGWNFMTVPMTIVFGTDVVSSDNARYNAPDDFYGIIVSPFTYGSTGPRRIIEPVSEQMIRELQAANDSTGDPVYFAVRAQNVTAASTDGRWEILFWPEPSGTQTVTALYKRFPAALSANSDRPVSGFQHDATLIEACLAAAELEVGDSDGPHEKAYQRQLAVSKKLDGRASMSRVQDYGDKSEGRFGRRRPLNHYSVDTVGGVDIDT